MNIPKVPLFLAVGLCSLAAAPGHATPERDFRTVVVRFESAGDSRFARSDEMVERVRFTLRTMHDDLGLDRSQRNKVEELVDKYRTRTRRIERDDRLAPGQRADRVYQVQRELHERLVHVLNADQKARLSVREEDHFGRRFARR